jgi:hypothetical protein
LAVAATAPAFGYVQTATHDVLTALAAMVDARIYRGMGHTIKRDELDAARQLLGVGPLTFGRSARAL